LRRYEKIGYAEFRFATNGKILYIPHFQSNSKLYFDAILQNNEVRRNQSLSHPTHTSVWERWGEIGCAERGNLIHT
jgi:hypothetical protein